MIAAIILASGICLSPPLYAMDGPLCADETVECLCSECMEWDAVVEAQSYEITRETLSTHALYSVGTNYQRFDGDGNPTLATRWCFANDSIFPMDGVLYSYQVRSCDNLGCSQWSNSVQYRGAPYACFDAGREVACYVGDALVTR